MTNEIALHCMKAYSEYHNEVCEECPVYGETGTDHCFEDALNMAIKALETIPKYKDAYNKGWCDGAKASYEHLKMCEEEQEPKHCDRNICIKNEYNGIGCDDCEVTKSQESKTGHWIIYDVHGHKACKCSKCDKDVGYPCNYKYCPYCGAMIVESKELSE